LALFAGCLLTLIVYLDWLRDLNLDHCLDMFLVSRGKNLVMFPQFETVRNHFFKQATKPRVYNGYILESHLKMAAV